MENLNMTAYLYIKNSNPAYIDKITITEVKDKHRKNKTTFTGSILNYIS